MTKLHFFTIADYEEEEAGFANSITGDCALWNFTCPAFTFLKNALPKM